MTDNNEVPASKRPVLVRGLYMLLMAVFWQVAEVVLFTVAALQFILALVGDAPNGRLQEFGRNLGIYLRQLSDFLTFASDVLPFPFTDWPSDEPKGLG